MAKVCHLKNSDRKGGDTKWIDSSCADTEKHELPLYTIKDNKPFIADLQAKDKPITFKVDTGAAVSIMSEENFQHHFPSE